MGERGRAWVEERFSVEQSVDVRDDAALEAAIAPGPRAPRGARRELRAA